MQQVFISYSRQDGAFAHRLATTLSEVGTSIWIDIEDIPAGIKWSTAVQKGLDACEVMLVIVSPASMASGHVEDEWQYYLDRGKRVIPILWRPAPLHFQLNRLQYIDFHNQTYDFAIAQLLSALGVEAPQSLVTARRVYDLFLRSYEDWIAFERREGQLLNVDQVELIATHVPVSKVTTDLLIYFLASLGSFQSNAQQTAFIEQWIKNIDSGVLSEALKQGIQITKNKARLSLIQHVAHFNLSNAAPWLTSLLQTEQDISTLHTVLQTLSHLQYTIPQQIASALFHEHDDWLIKTYSLQSYKPQKTTLLITDGTDFATELGQFAQAAGYLVVSLDMRDILNLSFVYQKLSEDVLHVYDFIILVRGDHYGGINNNTLYKLIQQYVLEGGHLLATAWVGWETQSDTALKDLLPFNYQQFVEDITLDCHPTDHPLAQQWFQYHTRYLTSFEASVPRSGSVILLETASGIPIVGYRQSGSGYCFYLNSCQHSCTRPQNSPFASSAALKTGIENMIGWIYGELK